MTLPTAAAPSGDEIHTWKPSRAEWADFVQTELDKLGINRAELERQARDRDFQSADALSLWMMIG